MIDFEKSKTLRPNPIIESGIVRPRALWPTSELGQILRENRPLHAPQQTVRPCLTLCEYDDSMSSIRSPPQNGVRTLVPETSLSF